MKKKGAGNAWGDAKRVEVVTTYIALGTAPLTSGITGVPVNTIRQWRLQPWWQELEDQIKQEDDSATDVKLKKIVDKSLEIVQDRLENGDLRYNPKTAEFSRSPVGIGVAHRVASEMLSKRDLLRNRTIKQVDQQSIQDHLANIAQELIKAMQNAKPSEPKLVEGVTIENPVAS